MKQANLDLGNTIPKLTKKEIMQHIEENQYLFLFVDLYTLFDDSAIHMNVYAAYQTPQAIALASSIQPNPNQEWRKFGRLAIEEDGKRKWKVYIGSLTLATITSHTITFGIDLPHQHTGTDLLDLLSAIKQNLSECTCA